MTTNAFWTQGEVQAGRSLARHPALDETWTQTLLYPPTVAEMRLRVGMIPSEDHLRWQIELLDPQTGEMLAMISRPGRRLSDLEHELSAIGSHLWRLYEGVTNPDPFP